MRAMAFDVHPDAEAIHRGVRVTLKRAELTDPAGGTHVREVVEAADAVVILPLTDDGGGVPGVVLIRNRRFAVRQTLWELPAGTVEPGEAPDDCAPRELEEETGYRAERVEKLTEYFPTPGFCTEKLHAYRATGLSFVGQRLDPTEKITAEVVPWDRAMGMIRGGVIQDAKSIAAMLFHHSFGPDAEAKD
jgi:ADP-ribose pyrophosphatase